MPKTSVIISFGGQSDYLTKLKYDYYTTGGSGEFAQSNPDSLCDGTVSSKPYATWEKDYFLLDGVSYELPPVTNFKGGYISSLMSDAAGDFNIAAEPGVTFYLTEVISSDAITLDFGPYDWPTSFDVRLYSSEIFMYVQQYNNLVASGPQYVLDVSTAPGTWDGIYIKFHSWNLPYRYARIHGIRFAQGIDFIGSQVRNAEIFERISPLSTELPINTLSFDLHSEDPDFSIINPSGLYANIKHREPVDVHEMVDNVPIYMGRFYLDDWNSKSFFEAHFEAVDAIGILEDERFLCSVSDLYFLEDFIAGVLGTVGLTAGYEPSFVIEDVIVWSGTYSGMLSTMTCREALQQVLLANGYYASCARSDKIEIKKMNLASDLSSTFDYTLTAADKGLESPIELRKLVTAVSVLSYEYGRIYYPSSWQEVYNKYHDVGTYIIEFDVPSFYGLETSTATLTVLDYGRLWVKFQVTVAGYVIAGDSYWFKTMNNKKTITNTSLPAGTPPNVINITEAELVTPAVLDEVAQRVYSYYAQRYVQRTKLYANPVEPGASVLIDVHGSTDKVKGYVEESRVNLSGGFTSQIKVVGVVA